jgi:SAM-dependent methyltransferase
MYITDQETRKKFFYAMSEAGMYDHTIEWVVPQYRLLHQCMQRLALESLVRTGVQSKNSYHVLDIGSGTGAEALPLLKTVEKLKLTALDLCSPMHEILLKNAQSQRVDQRRIDCVLGDILAENIYRKLNEKSAACGGFDLVISAFTIHHFSDSEKQACINKIASLLKIGGSFILGDLFSYSPESPWMSATIAHYEHEWIETNFENSARVEEDRGNVSEASKLRIMSDLWINHYKHDNILSSVPEHFNMLHNAGFSEFANPFRYWQVGLIHAIR